jgi:hypothetical protein
LTHGKRVTTYWNAKMGHADITRAVYQSVVEIDNGPLIEAFSRRVDAATVAMLESSSDVSRNLSVVNLTIVTTIFGTVRSVFERDLGETEGSAVQRQLILKCNAYLDQAKIAASAECVGAGL